MFTRAEYIKVLKMIGFEQSAAKRSDGAHRNFVHTDYPLIQITVSDHKNEKDLKNVYQQNIMNGICFVIVLDCLHNNKLDEACLQTILMDFDKNFKKEVKAKLIKLNLNDNYALMALMPPKLKFEMQKFINNLTNQAIVDYFTNIKTKNVGRKS